MAGNIAVLASFGVALLTVLRLYQVTGFNGALMITALGVVDRTQLILGALLAGLLVSVLFGSLGAAFTMGWGRGPTQQDRDGRRAPQHQGVTVLIDHRVAVLTLSLITVSVALPMRLFIAWITLTAAVAAAAWCFRRADVGGELTALRRPRPRMAGLVSTVVAVAFCAMTFTLFDLQTDEQVTVRGAVGDVVVYDSVWVMGEQGGRTLLMDDRQEARWVETSAITGRRICAGDPDVETDNVWQVVRRSSQAPTPLNDYASCSS